MEGVYQLGPGGFDRLPEATQKMLLDNARTAPLLFGGAPPPAITCDALRTFTRPTLVTHGEKTHAYYKLINEGVSKCVPGAQQVSFPNLVHNAPSANPAAFSSSPFRIHFETVRTLISHADAAQRTKSIIEEPCAASVFPPAAHERVLHLHAMLAHAPCVQSTDKKEH